MRVPIDHLVYATRDLERGMEEIERLTGISPTIGGQHPGRGTRNALIALGDSVYLEIVAPDRDQAPPIGGRWLGVDTIVRSRLTTWAAKASDLPALRAHALENGVPLGEVRSASRQRADGVLVAWQLTEPQSVVADGVVPFFIDWESSPHPASSAPRGALLRGFRIEHPHDETVRRMLRVLDLDVPVTRAATAAIVATIAGRHGEVELR